MAVYIIAIPVTIMTDKGSIRDHSMRQFVQVSTVVNKMQNLSYQGDGELN